MAYNFLLHAFCHPHLSLYTTLPYYPGEGLVSTPACFLHSATPQQNSQNLTADCQKTGVSTGTELFLDGMVIIFKRVTRV